MAGTADDNVPVKSLSTTEAGAEPAKVNSEALGGLLRYMTEGSVQERGELVPRVSHTAG
jgi:hypothetical protein